MKRSNLTIEVDDAFEGVHEDDYTMSLEAVIKCLSETMASIPVEYRDSASIKWGSGDWTYNYPTVSYVRPQTDEEVAEEEARDQRRREYEAERERARYEELKLKFEPSE